MVILEEGTNMYKYEKVEHDNELPTKLHDFYIEDNIGELIEKHWHRSIEILIPLYGSFILWINGNKVKITAGNIYIINSQDIHAIQAIEGERIYKGYALQIKYDYLRESYHDIDKIYFQQPNQQINKLLMAKIIDIINFYESDDPYNNIRVKSHIQMLVFLLLDNLSKKRIGYLEVKDSKYKDRITKIIKYLENNYQEDLSVKMIADEFGLSEGYLSKLFKESLGATVKEYLSRVRLWHAEEQLVETDYPVIDIAIGNGFPNVKSFNQAFKRKNVITPAKYREKMRK